MARPGFDADRLRDQLGRSDPEERRRAVLAVPPRSGAEGLRLLVSALGDESWRVRKEVVERLASWGEARAAASAMVDVLIETDDVGLRNSAIETLTRIGSPSIAPLKAALAPGTRHRKFLIDALGAIGHANAVDAVTTFLRDEDVNVRVAAAEALGRVGGSAAEWALLQAAEKGQMLVQVTALDALAEIGAVVPVGRLETWVHTPVVRVSALRLLGRSGDPAAVLHLIKALDDKTRRAREAAIESLMRLCDEPAGRGSGWAVVEALRELPESAVAVLIATVNAHAKEVRCAAAVLLGLGRHGGAVATLAAGLLDPEIEAACERGLRAMGQTAVVALGEIAEVADERLRDEVKEVLATWNATVPEPALARSSAAASAAGPAPARARPATAPPRAADVGPGPGMVGVPMAMDEFFALRDVIHAHCGIYLHEDALYRVQRRLAPRLGVVGVGSFDEYRRLLAQGSRGEHELAEAVERITTNETYFFREAYQLRAFAEEILPEIHERRPRDRQLGVWSAGCSTGEEAYTVAMLMLTCAPLSGWHLSVLGSDISRRVLQVADSGRYTQSSMRATDALQQHWFFTNIDGFHQVKPEVKQLVTFRQLNLLDTAQVADVGPFDVIFCRNVIMYFDRETRRRVIQSLYDRLLPGGYLLLGHSESLINLSTSFELVQLRNDTVYRRAEVQE
jgi:chemotaxis protein methyltransferase CheR